MINDRRSYSPADGCGFHTFARWMEGWPNAGFLSKTTMLRVRRVIRDGTEEVQIETKTTERRRHGPRDRYVEMFGALCLSPEDADKLIAAISKVRE